MTPVPWLSAVVLVPLAGALLAGVVSAKRASVVGLCASLATFATCGGLLWRLWSQGPQTEPVGGWSAPLGIELYADGFSALMLAMVALVAIFVSLFSAGYFRGGGSTRTGRHEGFFWSLWLVVWASLNGIFVSGDLFNLYVCMELMGLGSVALIALAGPIALRAAMRYLLVTISGSLLYLLGVALVYGGWGRLDLVILGDVMEATWASEVALAMMTVGLVLKTALVPLHFWLPAAHANAPAPVSAVLSALVVKASFFILVRLWIDVFGVLDTERASMGLATLGAIAIFWGSIQALRQQRLKMLVAYSTVAQIGYLFVAFLPAATVAGAEVAWHGAAYFAIAHGCAKGAMFLSAGAIAARVGSDRFADLRAKGGKIAFPLFTFAVAGIGLMGLPPSGGYTAKWLLLTAAARAEQPLVAIVVTVGGLLAALYVFKVIYYAFAHRRVELDEKREDTAEIPHVMNWAAFLLALVSVGLGLWSAVPVALLDVGLPFGAPLGVGLKP